MEPMTDTTQPPVTTEPDKWDTTTAREDWKTTASEWEYTTDYTTSKLIGECSIMEPPDKGHLS